MKSLHEKRSAQILEAFACLSTLVFTNGCTPPSNSPESTSAEIGRFVSDANSSKGLRDIVSGLNSDDEARRISSLERMEYLLDGRIKNGDEALLSDLLGGGWQGQIKDGRCNRRTEADFLALMNGLEGFLETPYHQRASFLIYLVTGDVPPTYKSKEEFRVIWERNQTYKKIANSSR